MTGKELALINLSETRRRSIKVWRAIPDSQLEWRPDPEALSFGESIRHVWNSSYFYQRVLEHGGDLPQDFVSPFELEILPLMSVEEEIARAEPVFAGFLEYMAQIPDTDFKGRIIDRSNIGYKRTVGDMLARVAYHDSIHTGQMLQMMRQAGLERPDIWD